MRSRLLLFFCLLSILIADGCTWLDEETLFRLRDAGKPAPDFTFTTYDGKTVTGSDLEGSVLLVYFWASWYQPSVDELAQLQELYQTYHERGLNIIALAYADHEPAAIAAIKDSGAAYDVAVEPENIIAIADAFHVIGIPDLFVIDPTGRIAEKLPGSLDYDELAAIIESLLPEESNLDG